MKINTSLSNSMTCERVHSYAGYFEISVMFLMNVCLDACLEHISQ